MSNLIDTDEILTDFYPRFRTYKSGRVERFSGTTTVSPGLDPSTGVLSKDLLLLLPSSSSSISVRLFLPPHPQPHSLPILLYFHGGGFCIESTTSPTYHSYLTSLSSAATVLILSVDYRRAPEHLLPTAYSDSWQALQWLTSSPQEEWLTSYADFTRLFLAGDSAGANIVHQLALRAGIEKLRGGPHGSQELRGAVLFHPYFWGSTPVGNETRDELTRSGVEWLWKMTASPEMGVDHPCFNPVAEGAPALVGVACRRVLVCVASEDVYCERGKWYYEKLVGSGWDGVGELWVDEGEGHVFHLKKPLCDKALEMMKKVVAFLNS
ncbi:putative carboxylesterase [Dioscorea sansibarensis]